MHQLATDVPFIACVINLPCIVIFYPLLGVVEFLVLFYNLQCCMLELVSAAGCHCIDLFPFLSLSILSDSRLFSQKEGLLLQNLVLFNQFLA